MLIKLNFSKTSILNSFSLSGERGPKVNIQDEDNLQILL
jgi:hypothetical protein